MTAKKDKGGFKAIISDMFELPREVVLDLPRLTLVEYSIYLKITAASSLTITASASG